MTTTQQDLKPGVIINGSALSEPIEVAQVTAMGNSVKVLGRGLNTNNFHQPIFSIEQLEALEIISDKPSFDGDAERFRIGVEALRLKLAHEYDPFFSLTIARVDPLPHQLEAVYDYFLKQPRIRFLLADDPGAGKTIMAGLLLKELKFRGLVQRTLIIAPANLTFQWQREMRDKFREDFQVMKGDVFRSNYGLNPWQEQNQVVTSVSWASRIEDAKESLLRSHWDLIIVDEAHKMSAYSSQKKTLAYQLGEKLSEMTSHYLLMTATPHKGDPENFCLFLELLDRDIYGDVASLQEAMNRNSAPFYLRRVKESLVTFPDAATGKSKKLFTNRKVITIDFKIDDAELDFYDALTVYVDDQSIKALEDDSARGRALGFTMAMLQRRFASSLKAVGRSLDRMRDKRQRILDDPEKHRQEQITKRLPDNFDELTEEEQSRILGDLESVVASVKPEDLRDEIRQLNKLIYDADRLQEREVESKLQKLRQVITENGIFQDPKMKLLIFTEHKDTLDYLVDKLQSWGLQVTQIHGGMNVGDRDTPGTRIYAERAFKEECQVLVATEAAGEGINLQFCWFMINYDIPWNPVRLEQRMGRIHRYGQEKDCLILNFVAINTREGRVFDKLFERIQAIEEDLDPEQTGKVFNVLGEIFPANQIEKMLRAMYAHNQMDEELLKQRIVEQVDYDHLARLTESALEGLAKKELNLSSLVGRTAEAKERRLVPEAIENFFLAAAPIAGITPQTFTRRPKVYRMGKVPKVLWPIGEDFEKQWGKLGREYKDITFDKDIAQTDGTLEWVTPGHPLFESMREYVSQQVQDDLRKGTVFFDLQRSEPACLDIFKADLQDGRANLLHSRLFVVQSNPDGSHQVRQPTLFLDLIPAGAGVDLPAWDPPDLVQVQAFLIDAELSTLQAKVAAERQKDTTTIAEHLEISMKAIIDRVNLQFAALIEQQAAGSQESGLEGRSKQLEDRLDELNGRLDRRRQELQQECQCTLAGVIHQGRAWILPHPDRESPDIAPMVSNQQIEEIAVATAIAYEESQGYQVESVESENRGFDLISRKPHPEDPQTAINVRFIEVKGRSGVGQVALTSNEFMTAKRLKTDYWLYVVYNCATKPRLHRIQDPEQLQWQPWMKVEHYQLGADAILNYNATSPNTESEAQEL